MPNLEPCHHECPRCLRPWSHAVPLWSPLDEFLAPCPQCRAAGFVVVPRRPRRVVDADEDATEDYRILVPANEPEE